MAGFRFDTFKGIRPRVKPRLLPPNEAQTSKDTRLGSGALEPWTGTTQIQAADSDTVQSIHRFRNDGSPIWFESTNDVDYADGPVPDDVLERVYFTGETQPRMTYIGLAETSSPYPADYRYLGIPAPSSAPTLVGDALLSDIVSGQTDLDGLTSPTLHVDAAVQDNDPFTIADEGYRFGDDAGFATAGTVRSFEFHFYIGKELRVTSVVDSDTVTLADASGASYLAAPVLDSRVDSASQDAAFNKVRRDTSSASGDGFVRFYLPNDIEFTISSHNLQVDDIITVTSVDSSLKVTFTQPASSGTPIFYGHVDAGGGDDPDVGTWAAHTVEPADSFYTGGRSYVFETAYIDLDGAGSSSSFSLSGQFSYSLTERGGIAYEDLLADIESRTYVFTYVSDLGEEGPPSPASEIVTIPTDGAVAVTKTGSHPTTQRQIDNWRIYRANTGNEVTEFQFVAEVAIGTGSYNDEQLDNELGEVLQTETWEPPPTGLSGIVAGPNGMMCGFVGKTIWLSEPYYPHAWPPEYKQAVEYDVVGIGILPNGFAILTNGTPYALVGDHPRGMSLQQFDFNQACVSKRSIVSTLDSVMYSSPDGLCEIGGRGFSIVTRNHATKREWATFNPTEIVAEWHDGKYIGFHSEGGLVYDPSDESIGFTTLSDVSVDDTFLDTVTDTLYVLQFGESAFTENVEAEGYTPAAILSGTPPTSAALGDFTYTVTAGSVALEVLNNSATGNVDVVAFTTPADAESFTIEITAGYQFRLEGLIQGTATSTAGTWTATGLDADDNVVWGPTTFTADDDWTELTDWDTTFISKIKFTAVSVPVNDWYIFEFSGTVLDTREIASFDTGSARTFTWKSGILKAPYPMNLGAARIVADATVTLNIWNDEGDLVVTDRSVTSNEVIRLPSGYLSDWFEIQVESNDDVELVEVAETVEELLRG